ncbi:PadR family transcriptional regulator [Clostridium estertheticum]|uniref:PadR family transcriptional regulator n=1 Tax=Clostridium estertheticum TaxID=238834 RepID=UPI001C6E7FBA|nr:PadR family transcriptional regulator [Clostridium estertheticum]MBW9152910.1 PadR family transcriptional regulator [Clostridium estertheticum]WLC82718.1 PadR family transcriptional regulator [Clostridium estertheticum]
MTKFIILGFLMTENMTGYDIKQKMSISTSNFMDASFGSIYPSLKRLEQKKLICFDEIVENGKLKKVYYIAEQGKEEFMTWLRAPIETSKTSAASALSKIFFFDNLSNEEITNSINTYIEAITILKNNLLKIKKLLNNHDNNFEICTLNFGLDFYEFSIAWYKNYLDKRLNVKNS